MQSTAGQPLGLEKKLGKIIMQAGKRKDTLMEYASGQAFGLQQQSTQGTQALRWIGTLLLH